MPTRRRIVYRQVEPTEWDAVAVVLGLVVGAALGVLLLAGVVVALLSTAEQVCRYVQC